MKAGLLYVFTGIVSMLAHMSVCCQETAVGREKYFLAGARMNYGFIIEHTKEIERAAQSSPFAIQADFSWHFNTENAYRFCNCLPRLGFSAYYWDYQNEGILGKTFSLVGFAEPFFNIHNRINISIRPGIGLAYMTNPFDSLGNPENLAYSTHIGYSLLMSLTAWFRMNDRLLFNAGINYNHISNGGVKIPNKGLNYPTLSLGFDYSFKPLIYNRFTVAGAKEPHHRNQVVIASLMGFKGLLSDNKTYPVYGLLSKYLLHLGGNSFLAGGFEFDVDQTKVRISELNPEVRRSDRYIFSFTSGYEHTLGKFSLTFDLGLYLRNPDMGRDILFQRYGAKIHLYKSFFAGINLKAHRHNAEFFDIRLGVRI